MRLKRVTAALLAMLMLFESGLPAATVLAAPVQQVKITFDSDDFIQDQSIVVGGDVGINISRPDGYSLSNPPLVIRTPDYAEGITAGITVTGASEAKKSLKIEENFFEVNDPALFQDSGLTTLDIQASYYAKLTKGGLTEQATNWIKDPDDPTAPAKATPQPPVYGSCSFLPELTIYETSSAILTCTSSESKDNSPAFKITEQKQAFLGYNTATASRRQTDKAELLIQLSYNSVNGPLPPGMTTPPQPCVVSLTPQSTHRTDDQGETLSPYDSYVQSGTKFTINAEKVASQGLFLAVHSKDHAAKEIASELSNAYGVVEGNRQPKFLYLAEGDQRDYIRRDFSVDYSSYWFNTQFYLEWKWVPKFTPDSTGKMLIGKNYYTKSQLESVVAFNTQPSGKQAVTVRPVYDTVEGHFEVGIRCRTLTGDAIRTATLSNVRIVGKGQPASLACSKRWYTEEVDGARVERDEPVSSDEINEKPPSTIKLDVYNGWILGTKIPDDPWKYEIKLKMGADSAASQYAVVSTMSGDPGVISMQYTYEDSSSPANDYKFGDQITNKATTGEGTSLLQFTPVKEGRVRIKVTYYTVDSQNRPIEALEQPLPFDIIVTDSSPSDDSTLRLLKMDANIINSTWGPKDVDFSFNPATLTYDVQLPYQYKSITVSPTANEPGAARQGVKVQAMQKNSSGIYQHVPGWVMDSAGNSEDLYKTVNSGSKSLEIPLEQNIPVRVRLVVTAEDQTTSTYTINVMRSPIGTDATLKSLTLTDQDGNVLFNGIEQNVFRYEVSLPYKVKKAKVEYELNDPNAPKSKTIFTPQLESQGVFQKSEWVNILTACEGPDGRPTMEGTFTMVTWAEDEVTSRNYTIVFKRLDPSDTNTLKSLDVLNGSDGDKKLTYKPAFHADMAEGDYYEVDIPHSTSKLKVSATPSDTGSTMYLLGDGIKGGNILGENENGGDGWMRVGANTPSKVFEPKAYSATVPFYEVILEVWPESMPLPEDPGAARPLKSGQSMSGENGYTITYADYVSKVLRYPIQIYREPASNDSTLLSIALADQDKKAVDFYDFDPAVSDYSLTVPFETEKIQVTPTATNPNVSKIEVNGRKVASGGTSPLIAVAETGTTIVVEVFPEDTTAASRKYQIHITRAVPSSDALLIKLTAEGSTDFKPVFAPKRTAYTALVASGAEGVKITATANHPSAKITIDGKRVESGQASELIRILEVNQTVKIVVEAQDGKTTMTYSIRFRNDNLVEKSSNADLEDLEVTPGVRRPKAFKPSVTTYEVAVDEDTFDVELIPEPADSLATMKVFFDSKEIGDDDDNYAAYIQEGENEFTIEVTSPDETKTKTYTVFVYREEEDKMGNLTPVDSEDFDFENGPDVIIVDISRYSRVNANVFEELRDYPNKKIIFQGNDYSLQFDASDINRIIPNTEIFDFGMSFDSPLEDEIIDEIDSHSGNSRISRVLVHFNYHGELPGPAVLTLSLGKRYKNQTMYWHYYNEERERIDYYGNMKTNSQGTFSLILDHMSTFIAAEQKLAGAENKDAGVSSSDRDLAVEAIEKKLIPNTGVGEERS